MFIIIHTEEDSGVMSLRAKVLSLLFLFGLRNSAKGMLFSGFMAVRHTAAAKLINSVIIHR